MCGIAGFIDFKHNSDERVLLDMVSCIPHRGPDDKGAECYKLDEAVVGFSQARLSIIDLSSGGHQPMHFEHLSIVFNGEIYNYKEVKAELQDKGHHFVSGSDTEVILHSYMEWGQEAVHRFIGMFAFLILDRRNMQIVCFNDRAGVKPLYYYWQDGLFLFASELKPFHKHPRFEKNIDEAALFSYFEHVNHAYIPAPYTIFRNTWKLEQGSCLTINLRTQDLKVRKYWEVSKFYQLPELKLSYGEAKDAVHDLLKSACEYRMVADVPVGVFLSGGYDSTLVTSILQHQRTEKLKTFTIGFQEGNNEAPFAKETAKYLGTDHTEYYCTADEAKEIIPSLPYFYDEPFADTSAIPTMLVSRVAKQKVTVALSADAGDEVFAGYLSYAALDAKMRALDKVPGGLKSSARVGLSLAEKMIPARFDTLKHKTAGVARSINKDRLRQAADLFHQTNCLPHSYSSKILQGKFDRYKSVYDNSFIGFNHELAVALAADYQAYLQNDILTKVDRATMSVSLEGREPLLDHRIVEFAAQLPMKYKYDGVTGKKILKDITHQYIPKEMMDRPKSGFSLPIYTWLRSDLRYLVEEHMSPAALAASGLFNVPFVSRQVELFKKNQLHYQPFIWKLLMFQMWYKKWMN